MNNWFECKISYEKTLENGIQKKVTEPYLIDALSFTEAEARIIEEIRPYISGEFVIADIKRAKLSELFFNENGDRFYKVKVYFITLDERSGAEKKTAATMLAQASSIKEALEVVEKGMEGTLADYVIASLTETAIMDVFPYGCDKEELIEVEFDGMVTEIKKDLLTRNQLTISFGDMVISFDRKDGKLIAINAKSINDDTPYFQRFGSLKYNEAKI